MATENSGTVERAIERLGWFALLALVTVVMWSAFVIAGLGIEELTIAHGYGSPEAVWPGLWLAIIPLVTLAVIRWHPCGDRLLALRRGRVGSFLPMLMAASMSVLAVAFILAPDLGPQRGFSALSVLGVVLAVAFCWVWTPFFPRIVATFAGACAGLAMVTLVGEPVFGSCLREVHHVRETSPGLFVVMVCPLLTFFWGMGALWLSLAEARPAYHSLWSGVFTLTMALIGIITFTAC